jgi:hypothetical protein
MDNTRNRGANVNNNNANNPPPPPTLEQVLIIQAQMLQTMQQTMANMQQAQRHQPAPQPQQRDKLREFQRTKPPTFSLHRTHGRRRLVENHREEITSCPMQQPREGSSHQLEGPAADWCDAYVEAHEKPESINWQELKNSFHSHHVPLGVMKLKKNEFEDLKQDSMSVSEYVTRFTQLSRYAPDNVDTNKKKQDWFVNDLNDGLAYALEARDFINFQDMVDKSLVLENRRGIMERKRKIQRIGSQGSNTRFHVGSSSRGPVFHPMQ